MDSYSAFFEADHKTPTGHGGLNQRGIDKTFVTGLATDLCVAWTAIDARNVV
jgi:nicotinamidase/pyrazinamidase